MKMRGDFHIQIISNLVDQRVFMANYMTKSPEYDPRSGGNLPPDAFLLSVIEPTRTPLVIAQPKYSHPALRDPNYDDNVGTSRFRDRMYSPVQVGKPEKASAPPRPKVGEPKAPTKKSSTVSRRSDQPITTAIDTKVDPLVRALRLAAIQLEARKREVESKLAKSKNSQNVEVAYQVPNATVQPTEAHVLASDTANLQQRNGNQFATRPVEVIKSGIVLGGRLVHDNIDIANFKYSDTASTGTNQLWTDTAG
jgi:hypothetical protein